MTRQLPSLSSGQLSSYYLGLCLFHRLISDRLEGMEGLHWLKLTPPEVSLFTSCQHPDRGFRGFFLVFDMPDFKFKVGLKKSVWLFWVIDLMCIAAICYIVSHDPWISGTPHGTYWLQLKRAGTSWVAGLLPLRVRGEAPDKKSSHHWVGACN